MKITLSLLSVFVVVAGVCTSQVPSPSPESAVRQADKAWSEAALSNDVEKMLAFYDEKGAFLGTTPATTGVEGLRQLWTRYFTMPGYKLTWKAERIEVSASGDLAYSFGPWEQTVLRDGQPRTTTGMYLAIWKKQRDGSWKVLADKP